MNWQYRLDGHTADAETRFVKMRIFVDMPSTGGMDSIRYVAHVETLIGTPLVSKSNIASMPEAKAWCELSYASLLGAELDDVRVGLTRAGLDAQTLGDIALGID